MNLTSRNLTFGVAGNTLEAGWPLDHAGWWLQVQTNALVSGLGTNWLHVPNSNLTNRVWIPIDLTNGCKFVRLYYPN